MIYNIILSAWQTIDLIPPIACKSRSPQVFFQVLTCIILAKNIDKCVGYGGGEGADGTQKSCTNMPARLKRALPQVGLKLDC